jgi:hypothetical protein
VTGFRRRARCPTGKESGGGLLFGSSGEDVIATALKKEYRYHFQKWYEGIEKHHEIDASR